MPNFYTSRSSIEAYQRCPRYRYLHDYYQETGIVPKSRSVPLTTGTCIHRGIEHLLSRLLLVDMFDSTDVDNACTLATNEYINLVENQGFYGKGVTRDVQQEYTFQEQKALTEALIRVWAMVEGPNLVQRFKVVGVERELVVPLTNDGCNNDILLQARVDGELQDRRDGSYFNYSLKTTKGFGEREEKNYKRDLQGLTEIFAVENHITAVNDLYDDIDIQLGELFDNTRLPKLVDIRHFLKSKRLPAKKVMGVKFCFLVKGNFESTEKGNPDAIYHTKSSLIRGYRNISPTSVNYAHSLYYPNSENKSGWGRLGKGWEEFDVWSDDGAEGWNSDGRGIKNWIERIALGENGDIQPECGDILSKYCVTPVEYFRDDREIKEAIETIIYQEKNVMVGLSMERLANSSISEINLEINPDIDSIKLEHVMQKYFPKHRGSCHYPTDCEYNPICWPETNPNISAEVSDDPIGSGLFQIRVPHHKAEKDEMERRDERRNKEDVSK